jgi:hypothetical protein
VPLPAASSGAYHGFFSSVNGKGDKNALFFGEFEELVVKQKPVGGDLEEIRAAV